MAKRFTDTEKWKRPWYRKLPPAFRELWNYILDSCDHAGVWVEDIELAGLILGYKLDLNEFEHHLGPKIIRVDDDKFFIPSFVEFQYGTLDPECKTHKSVIQILERYGIDTVTLQLAKGIENVPKGIDTLKDKDKDKDQDKEKDQEKEKDKKTKFDFDAIYQEYPRKDGKQVGIQSCKSQIKTQDEYEKLLSAVRRYRVLCEREGTEKKFIKHFSTFVQGGKWRDYLDPDTGTSIVSAGESFSIARILASREAQNESGSI